MDGGSRAYYCRHKTRFFMPKHLSFASTIPAQTAPRSLLLRSKLVSTLRSTRQDAQINYLSTLSIFMKQTTYLATLPKCSGKLLNSTMVSSHAPNASAVRRRCRVTVQPSPFDKLRAGSEGLILRGWAWRETRDTYGLPSLPTTSSGDWVRPNLLTSVRGQTAC
jgi:hypothetical protein